MRLKKTCARGLPALVLSVCHAAVQAQAQAPEQKPEAPAPAAVPNAADAAPKSAATTELQPVVVTSERRTKSLQKTALSITVLDGETLQQAGKSDIADILQQAPAVVFQAINPNGSPQIAIRGVGTDAPLGNAAVATYVDGFALKQGAFQFFDLERVEVLRGPQGTLYGRGAPAGAVNFITKDPEKTFGFEINTELGNHALLHSSGMLNVPISDAWAARVAFNAVKRHGYYDNGLSDDDERNLRLKLKYQPSARLSWVIGADAYRNNSKGDGQVTLDANQQIPGYVSNATTTDGLYTRDNYRKFTSNLNWDFGPATLTYLASYSNYKQDAATFFGGNSNHAVTNPDDLRTHELRFASNGAGKVSWIAGLYASDATLNGVTSISNAMFSGDFANQTTLTSRAIFAETTVSVLPDLRVTLGGRESRDSFDSNFPQTFNFLIPAPPGGFPNLTFADVPASGSFQRFDYKLRLEKDFGKDSMVYASLSTGYRPGGASGNGDGTSQAYGVEVNRAIELGSKNRVWGGRAEVNGSVFAYDYSGFQAPFQAAGSPFVTIVSHPARFYGGEIEGRMRLTEADSLGLNLAYLSSRYTDTSVPIPHAPRTTLGGGYDHTFFLANGTTIKAGADLKYQSSQYTNYSNTIDPGMYQGAYTIGNLHVGAESADGKYYINGYVKNVTNKLYKLTVNQQAGSGSPDLATISAPRTYGVVFGVKL